jgi:hypothetical protein
MGLRNEFAAMPGVQAQGKQLTEYINAGTALFARLSWPVESPQF